MKALIAFFAVASGVAFAQQEDAPIPFESEAPVSPFAPVPKRENVDDPDDFSQFTRYKETKVRTLASLDDPSTGFGFDILGGVLWMDESKKGSHAQFTFGARLTWEWSRAFLYDEYWRKAFFVDLAWNIAWGTEGTELVQTRVIHNYLVLAPAISFPFADGLFAIFIQGGAGAFFLHSKLTMNYSTPIETATQGTFLLGQYGFGLRTRIVPDPQKGLFFILRTELTGLVHRYSHDIMVSASMGIGF